MSNLLSIINQSKKTCVLLGDFNIDILQYDFNSNVSSFVDTMYSDSFFPLITKPTRITDSSSTLIDNIYCNNVNIFTLSGILVSDISDHFPVVCSSTCDSPETYKDKSYVLKRHTSGGNYNRFIAELNNFNWQHLYSKNDVNEACNFLTDVINDIYEKNCPIIRSIIMKSRKRKPWITPGIFKSITTKKRLYKLYVQNRTPRNKLKYLNYKNVLISTIGLSKKSYYSNLLNENRNNQRETWKTINEIIGRGNLQGNSQFRIDHDGELIDTDLKVAECFNDYFSSIGQSLANDIQKSHVKFTSFLTKPVSTSMFASPTNCIEISSIISKLKKGSVAGLDGISTHMLRSCPSVIPPLTYICNLSLSSGIVPSRMKIARVTPIFKAGDPTLLSNYRPISILPTISKVLEKIMYS